MGLIIKNGIKYASTTSNTDLSSYAMIDDTIEGADTTWSSKKIKETYSVVNGTWSVDDDWNVTFIDE